MGDGKPENLNDPEEEEAFSLSNSEESSSSELFEFFVDLSTEMCPAEDIIISGKIVPLNCKDQQQLKRNAFRRLPQLLETTRSNRTNKSPTSLIRYNYSHSLDNSKLHRPSSSDPPVIERNSTQKIYSTARTKSPKSRWYLLMFGLMKFPPEMDIIDIKTRKARRNQSAKFPSLEADSMVPVRSKGSWRLFNVLSCKDHASISVTTSFGSMPN